MHRRSRMGDLKQAWLELKSGEPGKRFSAVYERHGRQHTGWTRVLYLSVALISFLIGVVLAFIPGPAILFFAITGALLATQSRWVARELDAIELKLRDLWQRWQARRARSRERRASPPRSDRSTIASATAAASGADSREG
jgi:hypothetical protein